MTEHLHSALYALPDVTLAVEPGELRIIDVNRTGEVFGYAKHPLCSLPLDSLLDRPRAELAQLVTSADGRTVLARVRRPDGKLASVSVRASSSGAAAAVPCVLVVLREIVEDGSAIEDARRALRTALDSLDRIPSSAPSPPSDFNPRVTAPAASGRAPTLPFQPAPQRETVSVDGEPAKNPLPFKPPEVPDLTVEQFAALTVELDAASEGHGEILRMYGIASDALWRACEAHWSALLDADPALRKRCMKLVAAFRAKLGKGPSP